jgi:hypothetical protein
LTIVVLDVPVVSDVTLLADVGTAPSTWLVPVGGTFSTGFDICIDPMVDNPEYYFLDINTLTSSAPLKLNTLNGFNIDETNVPANWFDYWAAKGVTAGAGSGTWQEVMWPIINGNAPILYINYTGTDYQLIDGLMYQYASAMLPLRISGDYPEWNYSFNGRVESVDGCMSSFFDVFLEINSLTAPTFAPVPAICAGGSLDPLPTTSVNGITGTWAPALNNLETTTYTFTPDAGQCATETTLTIVVLDVPVVSDVTLLADVGTAPSTWLVPVGGTFSTGFDICIDPMVDNPEYYFLDINTLTSSAPLKLNTLNGFNIDETNVPANWFDYWAAKGVTAGAGSGTWQEVMWPIINGNAPILYINYTGTDYQLIDGLMYQYASAMLPLRISGDYPEWDYSFNGRVESVDGCMSSFFDVFLEINSLTAPTFAPVPAICAGGSLDPLPTTSVNGITGTWAPALNNLETTTYTFTPDAGQCATETTLTIVVLDVPVVSDVTLLADVGTAPSTWLVPVGGTFSTGFDICIDPMVDNPEYYFLDINTLTSSAPLKLNTLNGFSIDETNVPANWFDYWAAKGVTAGAGSGTWQEVMWPIINGNAPILYINYTGTDYQLIDGLMYQYASAMLPLRISGDYPEWDYSFNGRVESVDGCMSSFFDVFLEINSLTAPTFAPVPAICSGGSLDPLPTTSTNGITGTWAPALNNLETTTYTFTPDAGQCATETTLTIVVLDVPVVSDVTLLADVGTAPSTWLVPVGGTFSTGFDICIDPMVDNPEYYFLDINTLTSSAPLKLNTLNGFSIDETNVPANWFDYWAAKGVTAGAGSGTWQEVMWPIINGNAPILYINYTGTDYQLIDGLMYQYASAMLPLRISGDYPEWDYSFNGRVESVDGCMSSFFDVFLEINSLTAPTFAPVPAICAGGSLDPLPTTSVNGITGTWAPALNNLETTTYTFTPDAGQCATEATLTIIVNPLPIVSADNNGPLALGATLNLTGTADIGSSFSWTGPDGFTSDQQNPSILSVTEAAAGTYYFTATADGCSATASTLVVIIATPTELTITAGQTVCNDAVATLSVTSDLIAFDSYIWSPVANLFTDPECLVEYTGTSATTVYVKTSVAGEYTYTCNASNSLTLLSDDATTTVTVIPASVTITTPPSDFCLSGSLIITADPVTGYGTATLQWQNSTDNSVFTDIADANGLTYTTPTLTSTTYYKLLVKIGATVCMESNVAAVTVNNPQVTETTPGARCGTGTVELAANVSSGTPTWYAAATGGAPLATGSPWTTPSINTTTTYFVGAEIVSTSNGDVTVGTGTTLTSATGYPTAFGNYYYQEWHQLVYTATELRALGLSAGNITSIKFNCSAPANPATVAGYTISIANTAASVLTGFTTTGLSIVYGPASYTSAAGWNTIAFSTPYYWNGTSNLIVDIRGSGSYGSANARTYYTATTGSNTVVYARSSSNNVNFWTSNPAATTSTSRFNITFSGIIATVCSSPRVAVEATINTPPAISATATPSTICSGEPSELNVSSDNTGYTYLWTPGDLAGDTHTVNPNATTTYTVTATDNSGGANQGCVASASVGVTVNPVPTVTASASTSGVCAGAPFNLYSDANSNSAPANNILLDPTGDGGFETGIAFADNNWTVVNSASNFWVLDNLAPAYAGSLGAHISLDGSAYNYSNAITATSHLYRDVVIPAGSSNISLKFYWKGNGESGWDRMLVYTAPTSVTPVVNVPVSNSTTLSGATLRWTQTTFPQGSYTQVTVALPNSLAGTTVRLIFTWQGDNSLGNNPPAAIDNIMLSADVPAPPAYTWSSVPAGFTSTDQNPVGVTQTETTEYIVTAENSFGCTASASVTVTNVTGAEITGQPVSTVKCAGETASFTVVVSGSGLTYQWRKGGIDISVIDNPTAVTQTLSLVNVTEDDEAGYDVVVSASCGNPVTSDPATLTVNPLPVALISGPATGLTYQPLNYEASGYSDTPDFQWQFATAFAGPYNNFGDNTYNTQAFANAGTTFYIRCIVTDPVTGCSAESNIITTLVSVAGDNVCEANPIVVGINGLYTNIGATAEPGEAAPPATGCTGQSGWCSGQVPNNSVWFSFVAPPSGRVSINFGTTNTWDSQIALWSAPSCGDLLTGGGTLIAANDDAAGSPYYAAITPVCVIPGQTYYVQVDGYGTGTFGAFQLVLVEEPAVVTASVSAFPVSVCYGENADITFTGTPGATVTYDINGGTPITTVLTGGTSVVNTGVITSDVTYNLLSVTDGPCTLFFESENVTITVIPGRILHLTSVFLEGLYNGGGTMNQAKNDLGNPEFPGFADEIIVELHDAADYNAAPAYSATVLLGTSGNATVACIPLSVSGDYYITVKHRNSIETTTAIPVSFTGLEITQSFGAPADVFGGNLQLMVDNYYTIFAGDVNQDGTVDTGDMTFVDNDNRHYNIGYIPSDINGDGLTDQDDLTIVDNNSRVYISRVLP